MGYAVVNEKTQKETASSTWKAGSHRTMKRKLEKTRSVMILVKMIILNRTHEEERNVVNILDTWLEDD